jgi:hypothetical protein
MEIAKSNQPTKNNFEQQRGKIEAKEKFRNIATLWRVAPQLHEFDQEIILWQSSCLWKEGISRTKASKNPLSPMTSG